MSSCDMCSRWSSRKSSSPLRSRPWNTIGRGHAPTPTSAIIIGGCAANGGARERERPANQRRGRCVDKHPPACLLPFRKSFDLELRRERRHHRLDFVARIRRKVNPQMMPYGILGAQRREIVVRLDDRLEEYDLLGRYRDQHRIYRWRLTLAHGLLIPPRPLHSSR